MVPGLGVILEYQLAAERLHDHPFRVVTKLAWASPALEPPLRTTTLTVYVKYQPHEYEGETYEEAHHKAVRAFMLYGRLDRIRGTYWEKTAWW